MAKTLKQKLKKARRQRNVARHALHLTQRALDQERTDRASDVAELNARLTRDMATWGARSAEGREQVANLTATNQQLRESHRELVEANVGLNDDLATLRQEIQTLHDAREVTIIDLRNMVDRLDHARTKAEQELDAANALAAERLLLLENAWGLIANAASAPEGGWEDEAARYEGELSGAPCWAHAAIGFREQYHDHLAAAVSKATRPENGEHVTNGDPCWCNPRVEVVQSIPMPGTPAPPEVVAALTTNHGTPLPRRTPGATLPNALLGRGTCGTDVLGFRCTRPKGHFGSHVSTGVTQVPTEAEQVAAFVKAQTGPDAWDAVEQRVADSDDPSAELRRLRDVAEEAAPLHQFQDLAEPTAIEGEARIAPMPALREDGTIWGEPAPKGYDPGPIETVDEDVAQADYGRTLSRYIAAVDPATVLGLLDALAAVPAERADEGMELAARPTPAPVAPETRDET